MIPDKIYTFQDDGDRYWYKPEEWETPPLTRVEYIRKDVLLEWAKAYKEEADASTRGRTDNPSWGESTAMKNLIEKINSL